ncbi:MAG: transposase, partial [Oscillospiraceae bacterium]
IFGQTVRNAHRMCGICRSTRKPTQPRSRTDERVLADAKERHGMRCTILRNLCRVTNWVRLAFAAMNMKQLPYRRYLTALFDRYLALF